MFFLFCRWLHSGVWGRGDLPGPADALAEAGERCLSSCMLGISSHFTGIGGSLPLQKGQCTTSRQEEGQGQEEQEEIKDKKGTINYLNNKNKKNLEKILSGVSSS